MKKSLIILLLILISTSIVFSAKSFDELFYPLTRPERNLCENSITTRFELSGKDAQEKFFNIFLTTSSTLQASKKQTPENYLYEISWYLFNPDDETIEAKIYYYDGVSWKLYAEKKILSDKAWMEYRAEYSNINMSKMKLSVDSYDLITNVIEVNEE